MILEVEKIRYTTDMKSNSRVGWQLWERRLPFLLTIVSQATYWLPSASTETHLPEHAVPHRISYHQRHASSQQLRPECCQIWAPSKPKRPIWARAGETCSTWRNSINFLELLMLFLQIVFQSYTPFPHDKITKGCSCKSSVFNPASIPKKVKNEKQDWYHEVLRSRSLNTKQPIDHPSKHLARAKWMVRCSDGLGKEWDQTGDIAISLETTCFHEKMRWTNQSNFEVLAFKFKFDLWPIHPCSLYDSDKKISEL